MNKGFLLADIGAIVSHGVFQWTDSIIGAGHGVLVDCPADTFTKRSA